MITERNPLSVPTVKAITLQDIADRCKLDKTTVSRALRDDRKRVNAQTIQFVHEIADEMGYDPSRHFAARQLALQRMGRRQLTHTVATFFPRLTRTPHTFQDPYYRHIYLGIVDEIMAAGFGLLTIDLDIDTKTRITPAPYFASGFVDGVITMGLTKELPVFFSYLREKVQVDFPVVSVLHEFSPYPSVQADDRQGAYLVADHLLALGHRHLLHFQPGDSVLSVNRLTGYHEAYAAHGLSPEVYLHSCPDWTEYTFQQPGHADDARLVLRQALQRWPYLTGILANNDLWAEKLAECLAQLAIAVPEQMSLVGFDDTRIDMPDALGTKQLTTVRVPLEEIGRRGALLLLDLIQKPVLQRLHAVDRSILPVQLVVRTSTAPPRER